mgnify:FL=1
MFRLMEKARKNNKGFSLVELIVVVLIIAIIAVALAPQVVKYVGQARTNVEKNNQATVKTAVQTAVAEYQGQEKVISLAADSYEVAAAGGSSRVSQTKSPAVNGAPNGVTGGKSLLSMIQANVGEDKLDHDYTVTITSDATVTVKVK